jgi:hypothetical protein
VSAKAGNVIELPASPGMRLPVATAPSLVPAALPTAPAERARQLAQRAVQTIAHWAPQVRYRALQLGPAGLAGAATIASALLAALLIAVPAHRGELLLQQQLLHAPAAVATDGVPVPTQMSLLATLPARAEVPAVLGTMLKEAQQSGIVLEKGHYDFRGAQAGVPARYTFEFPVKGPYPNVRSFIDHTLTAVPAVALEKLRIERKAVGDAAINADVTFSLFVRGE